jgi:hypothetical protein
MGIRGNIVRLAAGITLVGLGSTGVSSAQVGASVGQTTTDSKVNSADRAAALKCMGDVYRLNNGAFCKANNLRLAAITKTAQASGSGNESRGVATAASSKTFER